MKTTRPRIRLVAAAAPRDDRQARELAATASKLSLEALKLARMASALATRERSA